MKPEHKRYIRENAGKLSTKEMARQLGLSERKVANFLEQKGIGNQKVVTNRVDFFESIDKRFLVIVLAALVFAIYANAIPGKFVWDDQTIVVRNDAVTSFKNIPYVFTHEFGEMCKYRGNIYRPMQELSYMIDHSVAGMNPVPFHITSILLHIGCAVVLFFIALSVSSSKAAAFFVSLLFGAHTINTEAVTYIAGRSDPLYLFFLLASFLLYIKSAKAVNMKRGSGYLLLSLISFSLSLLSRETAVVFPLILVAYEIFFAGKNKIRSLFRLIPFFIILWLSAILRLNIIGLKLAASKLADTQTLIFTDLKIIFDYLSLLVLPVGLHMERVIKPAHSIVDPSAFLGVVALVVLILPAICLKEKRREFSFWLAWFFILLLPHLNLVGLNALLAEHWIYGASIGIYAIFVMALFDIADALGIQKKFAYISLSLLALFFSVLTISRNLDWKDEPTIYGDTLKYIGSARVLSNLGVYYDIRKQYDKSLEAYKAALEISSKQPLYHNNIALIYLKTGDIKMAVYHWKKSLELKKDQPEIEEYLREYGG